MTGCRFRPARARRRPFGKGIVVLRDVHRYGGGIAALAQAIQEDDADGAMAVLREDDSNVHWIAADAAEATPSEDALRDVRRLAVDTGRAVIEFGPRRRRPTAIDALGRFRLLCGHRHGPEGVATWMEHIENWLRPTWRASAPAAPGTSVVHSS